MYYNNLACTRQVIKQRATYVMQADRLLPNLTVRETLRYTARLKLPGGASIADIETKVNLNAITIIIIINSSSSSCNSSSGSSVGSSCSSRMADEIVTKYHSNLIFDLSIQNVTIGQYKISDQFINVHWISNLHVSFNDLNIFFKKKSNEI